MLKKFYFALLLVVFSVSVAAKTEINMSEPYTMVQQVANSTFERVTTDQALIENDKEHLRLIVQEELLPYIDYKYSAYKVLGSYIQRIRNIKDKEQKKAEVAKLKRFINVFRDYLVATYAGVFTQYNGQKVEFEPAKKIDNKKFAVVKTKIVESGKPDINIGFKVKKNKKGDWQAYDMVAEGISLLDAKQSELHGILRTEGLDYVIDLLEKKSKLPVQFRGKSGAKAS